MAEKELVRVEHLCRYFRISRKLNLHAVDDVNFGIRKGETLGLVGESGCGKSTLGRTVLGLYPPTSGRIVFDGADMGLAGKEEKRLFRKRAQIILQDPYASLNPRMTVCELIGEGLDAGDFSGNREERIHELLRLVGLRPEFIHRFPHEFSGGQRQRIGIARTLAVEPEFIVCDEPISALDVSVQAQIVNLFMELKEKFNLTYLFIAHDLSMVRYISDRVGVMYLGRLVETGRSEDVYGSPAHPYTKALISAIPGINPAGTLRKTRLRAGAMTGSPVNPGPGCRFAGRCPYTEKICREENPPEFNLGDGHKVYCHLVK